MIEYIIIFIIFAAMIGAAVVGCWKPGKNDNICKYNKEDRKK